MGNILYSFRRCPYAMRARMALHLSGAQYEHREVLLRDKPDHMLEVSPKGSVPVLITDEIVIDESLDIMLWALPDAEFKANIIEMIDGPFKHHLDRYKYASRYDPSLKRGDIDVSHKMKAIGLLKQIETPLTKAPFLCGPEMGPTDIAAFPFIRQFAAVEADWWAAGEELPLTRDWLTACVNSNIFQNVMQKFPLWKPVT